MDGKILEVYKQAHVQAHGLTRNTRTQIQPYLKKTDELNTAIIRFVSKYKPALKEATPTADADLQVLASLTFSESDMTTFGAFGVPDVDVADFKDSLLQLKTLALTAEKKRAEASPEGLEALQLENAALKLEMGIADYKVCDLKQMLSKAIGLLEKNGVSVKPLFEG